MFMKIEKVTVNAKVMDIVEVTAANPTMTMARNVPLSSASSWSKVTFAMTEGEGEMTFRLSDSQAGKLTPGMRGQLTYKGEKFVAFKPENS